MTQEIKKEVKELQELINNHDNIVFFGGAEYQLKVESRISEARTDYITRNTTTRQKRF